MGLLCIFHYLDRLFLCNLSSILFGFPLNLLHCGSSIVLRFPKAASNFYKRDMETPLLRVSRPISACSRCRNAKIKCDGKLPACSACERSNKAAECSSANDQFAKGKERSYVASLESRIERLERHILQTKARQGSIPMLDAGSSGVPSTVEQAVGSRRRKERAEVSDVDDLVSDFGFL